MTTSDVGVSVSTASVPQPRSAAIAVSPRARSSALPAIELRASASGPTALDETLGGPSAERTLDGLLHTDEGLGPDEEKATVAVSEPAAAVVGQSAEQQSSRHLIARRHR